MQPGVPGAAAPPPPPPRDPLFAGHRTSRVGSILFGIASLALHGAFVGAVFFGGHAGSSFAAERDWIDVSVEPALGSPQGSQEGKGLGSHVVESLPMVQPPAAARQPAARPAPRDPNAPADPAAPPAPAATGSVAQPAEPAPAGPASTEAAGDPSTPPGTENVAPGIGRPDGTENGTGTEGVPKPRMTPQYAGQLAGWFGSRFNVRGLGLEPEELKKLSVAVSISISADRHVTGFSLRGSSGNSAYDEEVRRTIAGIQAGGLALPEPTDGSTPPATFTVRFRPQVIR
jgi:outer membrane biosynthesis protein TonB